MSHLDTVLIVYDGSDHVEEERDGYIDRSEDHHRGMRADVDCEDSDTGQCDCECFSEREGLVVRGANIAGRSGSR